MKDSLLMNRVLRSMYMGFLLSNDDNKYSESSILSISIDDMLFFLNKFNSNIHLKNKNNQIEFSKKDNFIFFTVYGDLLMVVSTESFVKDFINLVLKNYKKVFPDNNLLSLEIDIYDLNTLEKLPLYDISKENFSLYEGYYRKLYKINKLNLFKII